MIARIIVCVSICLVLFSFSFSPLNPKPVSAHIEKSFGNYIVELGWNNEPALTGQMNAAQLTIVKGSHVDTGQPVINALANMTLIVQYGTITKSLDFLPSPTVNGQYLATILPTQPGTYNVIMNGTIEAQPVNTEIPLDEVESLETVSFPQTGSSSNSVSSSQLGTVINQLTNDITNAKNTLNSASLNYETATKSIQDQQDSIDRLYMIAMLGIGIAGAGIVIAVIALTRKVSS